jgi:hypothetical protein
MGSPPRQKAGVQGSSHTSDSARHAVESLLTGRWRPDALALLPTRALWQIPIAPGQSLGIEIAWTCDQVQHLLATSAVKTGTEEVTMFFSSWRAPTSLIFSPVNIESRLNSALIPVRCFDGSIVQSLLDHHTLKRCCSCFFRGNAWMAATPNSCVDISLELVLLRFFTREVRSASGAMIILASEG